jgi:hypothetical protein
VLEQELYILLRIMDVLSAHNLPEPKSRTQNVHLMSALYTSSLILMDSVITASLALFQTRIEENALFQS